MGLILVSHRGLFLPTILTVFGQAVPASSLTVGELNLEKSMK